jgi:hypothetical protein
MHHLNEIYLADYGIGIKINGTPDWAKGRGRKAMHPYDDWFNGDKWLLQRPHHFDVSRQTLSKRIRQQAAIRKIRVTCCIHVDPDSGVEEVFVQRLSPVVRDTRA